MGRACSTRGEKRNSYSVFEENADGKRPLEDMEDNIKMNLR
jgi:hypothetical protein